MQKGSLKRRRGEGAPENREGTGPGPAWARLLPREVDDCRRNVCKMSRGCRLGQVVAPDRKKMVRSEVFCLAQTGCGRSEHGWEQRAYKAIVYIDKGWGNWHK